MHREHPDWVNIAEVKDLGSVKDVATMCYQSPYTEEIIIPQMIETIDRYNPDGLFIDIVLQQYLSGTCHCRFCRALFNKEIGGEIPKDNSDPNAFTYRKWSNRIFEAHMEKVYRAVSSAKPDLAVINNYCWMFRYPVSPPDYYPHICWDTASPANGLYALNFSLDARYLSTIPNITWSVMSTRGNTWGDFSFREAEAYRQECATPLAGCGRIYLSDDAYPSGKHDPAVMEVYSTINKQTRELEPFLKGCKPVRDTAVLHSADSVWSRTPMMPSTSWAASPAYFPVTGAHKALVEGHVQFGILNSRVLVDSIDDYKALILPDQLILNDRECEAIRRFVRNGGSLLATGETGIRDTGNNTLSNFSIADVLGVEFLESSGTANCYIRMKSKDARRGIPSMDIQIVGRYARVKTITADTILELVPPYEGIKTGTPPPSVNSDGPGVTINSYGKGRAMYCAAPLFNAYYTEGTPVLRKLALWMLDKVHPDESRSVVLENTPINVEVFYNYRGNERFIHLINYSGDKRELGLAHAQDFTTVHGMTVRLRLPEKPKRITLVPDNRNIDFTYSRGWLTFEALPLTIHHVYKIGIS